MSGVEFIAGERQRQVEVEGWTPEHDDQHIKEEMVKAAACYLLPHLAEDSWPWDEAWWKPKEDRIRQLKIAGALIAAEIDRLIRAEIKGS